MTPLGKFVTSPTRTAKKPVTLPPTHFLAMTWSLTVIATWVSLWVSYQKLPTPADTVINAYMHGADVPVPIIARGGWPLPAFKYPVSPLGSDIPNPDSLFPFILNLGFWFAISTLLLWFVPAKWHKKWIEKTLIGLAILTTIISIGYLLVLFD